MLLAAWLWLAAPPTPSSSAPSTLPVSWLAPEPCPSEAAFVSRVEQLRGGMPLTASFEFVIVGEGPFELELVGHDERFEAPTCEPLVETALLLVSLALASDEPRADGPATATSIELPESVRRSEARDVAPFLRATRLARDFEPAPPPLTPVRLSVEVGLTAIITPRPALDLFVGVGPRGRINEVELELDLGVLGRPRFEGTSLEPSVGVRLSSVGGLVRGCIGGRTRRVGVSGCAGVEVATVFARATGDVLDARPGRQPWAIAEVGPELTVPIASRIQLSVRIAASWLAVRPNFVIAGVGTACCAQPLGISSRVGVVFGLGR
jgi:hypothetical protein